MPFKSKQQQRFMFATMPELAKEWAKETDFDKIPKKVRKKKKKKDKKDKGDCAMVEKLLEMADVFDKAASLNDQRR